MILRDLFDAFQQWVLDLEDRQFAWGCGLTIVVLLGGLAVLFAAAFALGRNL